MSHTLSIPVFCAMLAIAAPPARAETPSSLSTLDFSPRSAAAIAHALPNANAVKALILETLSHGVDSNGQPAKPNGLTANSFQVMDDFKVTALSGDGAVAVVARLDFSGRGRPSEMIAITKKNGLFQYALLAAGEGAYGIGTLDKVLVELDKTGSKAIVLDERAPADDKGNVYASADAAPTVTNIYALANGRLSLVNKSHGDYYKSTVIPRLTARLDNARNQAATADDPEMLENLQQQIDSLSKSVDLATQAGGGAASQ